MSIHTKIASSISLLHVNCIWVVNLYSKKNLESLNILSLLNIKKYPKSLSFKMSMAKTLCVLNNMFLLNFKSKNKALYKLVKSQIRSSLNK